MVDDATMYVRATHQHGLNKMKTGMCLWFATTLRATTGGLPHGICQYTFLQCSVTLTATWTEMGLL